ncbi:MAG: PfkB family carbohydrate kinase [Rhodanobacter sp.]|jgi:fructokinase|nr:PfkB family carbohydrate kinase [Rhodanobacter sp.]
MAASASPVLFGEALVDAFPDALVPGGAPFNVACHLSVQGLAPLLLSRIGDDDAGTRLRAGASHCGLTLQGVQMEPVLGTARVIVHEQEHGHAFEIPAELAFDHIDAAAAVAAVSSLAPTATDWLYHGTLALRAPASRAALVAVRASRAFRVFVDLNWREAGPPPAQILSSLQGIEVLKLSEAELSRLLGWLQLPAPPETRPLAGTRHPSLATLIRHTAARSILVTHGGDGAAIWNAEGVCSASMSAPTPPRMVDTVGAGDAFSARMLAALVRGQTAEDALAGAVAFASASCGWRGAIPADLGAYDTVSLAAAAPHPADPMADL